VKVVRHQQVRQLPAAERLEIKTMKLDGLQITVNKLLLPAVEPIHAQRRFLGHFHPLSQRQVVLVSVLNEQLEQVRRKPLLEGLEQKIPTSIASSSPSPPSASPWGLWRRP
jgi:hypothetical protein